MSNQEQQNLGFEAINKLKSTDPPLFLSPNSDLSHTCRIASQFLFESLKNYSHKSPFDKLLVDGFDAEQIWQQIDLQSQPLINNIKREIKRFEKNPNQILSQFRVSDGKNEFKSEIRGNGEVNFDEDSDEFEGLSDDDDDDNDDVKERENDEDEDDNGESEEEDEGEEDESESEDEDEEGEMEDDGDGVPEVEDDFLKIKDLEKFIVREEEREYGSEKKKSKKSSKKKKKKEEEEDGEDEIEDDDDDNDEFLMFGGDEGEEDESEDNIRYDDFFLPDKKTPNKKHKQVEKLKLDNSEEDGSVDGSDDFMMEDKDDRARDLEMEDGDDKKGEGNLSTYEKQRQKIKAEIEQMEAENLAPKHWTMQGEVAASKRPVDSALEVDGDVVYTRVPPPVITEEVTESLEEIIKKRILEGQFDDVKRAPKLPSSTNKETKELDDNKSKKGLAELYEEDYAKQTGLVSAPMSFSDELHKEASDLFKKLCLKLDALSHFHFAPKPVVEDMSIQNNVPALAMEEIAPIAKSDADMLAPEEVFSGKGDIKEENELTKEDRKKRRAKKKRKFKAVKAKRAASQTVEKPAPLHTEGKDQ